MSGSGQLDRLRREFDQADARALALAASCSTAQWTARPDDGGWSPSECVQHLVLSVDATLARMDAAIAAGIASGRHGEGPFRPGLIGRLLMWSLEPPYRMKSKTGAAFVPPSRRSADEDVGALRAAHDRVRASLERARGLALDRLAIQSPFAERVRYNLYASFAILAVHARRHLWQAEQAARRTSRAAPVRS
jgi:hypothetical protein